MGRGLQRSGKFRNIILTYDPNISPPPPPIWIKDRLRPLFSLRSKTRHPPGILPRTAPGATWQTIRYSPRDCERVGEESGRRAKPWPAPGLASKLTSDRARCPVPAGNPGIAPEGHFFFFSLASALRARTRQYSAVLALTCRASISSSWAKAILVDPLPSRIPISNFRYPDSLMPRDLAISTWVRARAWRTSLGVCWWCFLVMLN